MESDTKISRSCTDIPCLIIFVIFFSIWISVGIYAFSQGNPQTLMSPKDSSGSRCGMDYHVLDKPFLFFFDLLECDDDAVPIFGCKTPQICVSNCPDKDFFFTGGNETFGKEDIKYCASSARKWNNTKCSKWYLSSYSFKGRCIPNTVTEDHINKINQVGRKNATVYKLTSAINKVKLLSQVRYVGQNFVNEILQSWWQIIVTILVVVLLCFIYSLLLGLVPIVLVSLSLIFAIIIMCCGLYVSVEQYKVFKYSVDNVDTEVIVRFKTIIWLCAIIFLSICLGTFLIVLAIYGKQIYKEILVVKECQSPKEQVPALYIFPFIPWILKIIILLYSICMWIHLSSTGKPIYQYNDLTNACKRFLSNHSGQGIFEEGYKCNPVKFRKIISKDLNSSCSLSSCSFISIKNPPTHFYFQSFNVILTLWSLNFISGLEEMILTYLYTQWYSSEDKNVSILVSAKTVLQYHLGSVAFGSCLIAVYRNYLIKVVIQFVTNRMIHAKSNLDYSCLFCCKFYLLFSETLLVFIGSNAYIFISLTGESFWPCAKESYNLVKRHCQNFLLPNVDFLVLTNEILVTIAIGFLSYRLFTLDYNFFDDSVSNYAFVPALIVMICTFFTCSSFFVVYKMIADTVFMCFLREYEQVAGLYEDLRFAPSNFVELFKL